MYLIYELVYHSPHSQHLLLLRVEIELVSTPGVIKISLIQMSVEITNSISLPILIKSLLFPVSG